MLFTPWKPCDRHDIHRMLASCWESSDSLRAIHVLYTISIRYSLVSANMLFTPWKPCDRHDIHRMLASCWESSDSLRAIHVLYTIPIGYSLVAENHRNRCVQFMCSIRYPSDTRWFLRTCFSLHENCVIAMISIRYSLVSENMFFIAWKLCDRYDIHPILVGFCEHVIHCMKTVWSLRYPSDTRWFLRTCYSLHENRVIDTISIGC